MSSGETYQASGITKSFAGVAVLHGIDFTVRPGTIHGLFGHNGAGKSTLLKILAGAQPQDGGTLSIGGVSERFASPRDALAKGIACVYQELRLIPNLTVAENLFLGREVSVGGWKQIRQMNTYAQNLLAEHGLTISATRPVRSLSHPEKQLVEVIANLDWKARFLFLDEPTTALDGRQSAQLLSEVRRIALERRIGVVLVSHKLDEVLAVCDEATVLSGGKVVFHAQAGALDKQAIVDAIVGDAHGHTPGSGGVRSAGTGSSTCITVKGLSGPRLSRVDLEARSGEVLGLYGLVGSGRTRFLRSLYGMEPVLAGDITLDGIAYRPQTPQHALSKGVALLTEERKIDGFVPLMSALQNVVLPTLKRYRATGFVSRRKADLSARRTLGSIGTRGNLEGPIKSLSGGNQQKVLLGRIIEQDAKLILLDEPTKGVDIGAKADIYTIIRQMADEGRCVIVVSSEEEELMAICDRIAIFRQGRCEQRPRPVTDVTLGDLRHAAWAAPSP